MIISTPALGPISHQVSIYRKDNYMLFQQFKADTDVHVKI